MNYIYNEIREFFFSFGFSKLKNKTILITGATGLIGTYFVETINYLNKEKNANISLFIVSHNGLPSHLDETRSYPWVKILQGDLSNEQWIDNNIVPVDFCIHAAGYGQPGKFTMDPIKTIILNTTATEHLIKKVKKGGSFLFISTSEVYSGLEKDYYTEYDIGTTNPLHPRACYIEGKRCGECICYSYRNSHGIDAKCARLALAYGPGTRIGDRRVLNEFIRKAIEQNKIVLMDSGSAIRTYCYVLDAVEEMWHILLHGKEPVYNVGGHSTITILDLAKKIASDLNVKVEVPNDDSEESIQAPKLVKLDLSRVEKEFKKTKYIDFDEGIKRTIMWQLRHIYNKKGIL